MIPTRAVVERRISQSEQKRPKKHKSLSRAETEAGIKGLLIDFPDSGSIDRADIPEEEKYMVRALSNFFRSGGARVN